MFAMQPAQHLMNEEQYEDYVVSENTYFSSERPYREGGIFRPIEQVYV